MAYIKIQSQFLKIEDNTCKPNGGRDTVGNVTVSDRSSAMELNSLGVWNGGKCRCKRAQNPFLYSWYRIGLYSLQLFSYAHTYRFIHNIYIYTYIHTYARPHARARVWGCGLLVYAIGTLVLQLPTRLCLNFWFGQNATAASHINDWVWLSAWQRNCLATSYPLPPGLVLVPGLVELSLYNHCKPCSIVLMIHDVLKDLKSIKWNIYC